MIYLDNNASMELYPEAISGLLKSLQNNVNAGSAHVLGRKANLSINLSREKIARMLGSKSEHVLFTSGATEANNIAMLGGGEKLALVSAMEHPSILKVHKNTEIIPVDSNGIIDLDWFDNRLAEEKPGDVIVSVMFASHDTGVLQPVDKISDIVEKHSQRYHLDAVQGAGKARIDFLKLSGVHSMSVASHKLGGSQGIGALIYDPDIIDIKMILRGGGQENGRRPGTPNLGAIISFGVASEICVNTLEEKTTKLNYLRNKMEHQIKTACPSVIIASENVDRLPGTSRLILPNIFSSQQIAYLDTRSIFVSAGAVCSLGTIKVPFSLISMGYKENGEANCSIRIGMSWNTTEQDIDIFIKTYIKMVNELK